MDFVRIHIGKNATLNSWTLFSSQKGTCSTIQVPLCEEKSVQLFRVAFFEVTSYNIDTLSVVHFSIVLFWSHRVLK